MGYTNILPSKFSINYERVIGFGIACKVDGKEGEGALIKLIEKYSKDFFKEEIEYILNEKMSLM